MPLLPITPTTFDAVARERVELHPREAEGAVAEQQHDLALGVRELRRERVAGARPQAAERARVQPAARLVGVDRAAGEGDEVAAVADDDRVAVEQRVELGVDPHRVQRRARVGAARRPRRARFSSSTARSSLDPVRGRVLKPVGRRAQRVERRADAAVELGRDRPRMIALGLGAVDDDDLGLLAERGAEAEPEVHRHADDDRDVGARRARRRARARRTARRRPARSRARGR